MIFIFGGTNTMVMFEGLPESINWPSEFQQRRRRRGVIRRAPGEVLELGHCTGLFGLTHTEREREREREKEREREREREMKSLEYTLFVHEKVVSVYLCILKVETSDNVILRMGVFWHQSHLKWRYTHTSREYMTRKAWVGYKSIKYELCIL